VFPATLDAVSPRSRVVAAVSAIALVAAGAAAGVAAVSGGDDGATAPAPGPERRAGAPPLALDLGFRTDPEAEDLRRAQRLYAAGERSRAGRLFARHDSLEARVGAAFAAWPVRTLQRLGRLSALHPRSALVQLHLGLVRFWEGVGGAQDAWREAVATDPDTPYAITAADLLHPRFARGLPVFVPSRGADAAITGLRPDRQLAALAAAARDGPTLDRLLYGVGLQRSGRPVSARRVFDAAATAAPDDPEAQVAAAVGRFDKARPADAFGRLGPLTRRFPAAATVRFHLGLLLLWSGQVDEAAEQLERATRVEPGSPLAREAERYLERLRAARG
jgi:tetratricopeptide (TPR) repeat protein